MTSLITLADKYLKVMRSTDWLKSCTTPSVLRALFIIIFLNLFLQTTLAIGPGTGSSRIRIDSEPVGPYVLLVATSPLPITVGQMNVWVRVMDQEGRQALRDAVVKIEATPVNGGDLVIGTATHQNAGNEIDYVAHLEVERAGDWQVRVTVENELGQAEVSFVETVTSSLNMGMIIGMGVPFVVLIVVVGIYLWRKSGDTAQSPTPSEA